MDALEATIEDNSIGEDWFSEELTIQEATHLLNQLSDSDKELMYSEDYKIFPTRENSYPHLRWRKGNPSGKRAGTRTPGSGVSPAHVDSLNGARNTGIKNTRRYRELMLELLPDDADPERRGSVGWIINQALIAIEGNPVTAECPNCEHEFVVYRKPDASILKELIHQTIGKADQNIVQSGQTEQIHRLIDERVSLDGVEVIRVHRQDPAEVERRKVAIEELRKNEAGSGMPNAHEFIEGEFTEKTDG